MCIPNADGFFVVDRLEEGRFVLVGEDGRQLPADGLPDGAREGSVLRQSADGWVLCEEETAARRARLEGKKNRIFRKRS